MNSLLEVSIFQISAKTEVKIFQQTKIDKRPLLLTVANRQYQQEFQWVVLFLLAYTVNLNGLALVFNNVNFLFSTSFFLI